MEITLDELHEISDNEQEHEITGVDGNETRSPRSNRSIFINCMYSHRGIFAALLASLCFAFQTIWVTLLKGDLPVGEVTCIRFALQGIFSFVALLFGKYKIMPQSRREFLLLLSRGFIGTLAICSIYFAIYRMSAAMVNTIVFGAPVFVGLFAWILLKELFFCFDIILMLVNIVGIVLIAQPPFIFPVDKDADIEQKNTELIGIVACVIGMLLSALTTINIRLLGIMNINAFKIVFYYSIIGTILPVLIFSVFREEWIMPSCGMVRYLLVGIGFLNFAAQSLVSYALTVTQKSYFISIVNSNQVPLTIVLELLILNVLPDWLSGLGAIIVVCSALGVVFRERMVVRSHDKITDEKNTDHECQSSITENVTTFSIEHNEV